jgi:hypothetical protein
MFDEAAASGDYVEATCEDFDEMEQEALTILHKDEPS